MYKMKVFGNYNPSHKMLSNKETNVPPIESTEFLLNKDEYEIL